MTTKLSSLKLFATQPHNCSYLDDKQATTVFIDPDAELDQTAYSHLSEMGFRRSGPHIYRPQCQNCQACLSSRIPVSLFKPSRSQKRCLKKNHDLTASLVTDINKDEHYQLYDAYIREKHHNGDMFPPSREQFDTFLTNEWGVTRYLEVRLHGELVAVAVTDVLDNGLSAIYTFYHPAMNERSLGVYCILSQIELTREKQLRHLYLGYWIKRCAKMQYKTQYRPIELLIDQQWLRFNRVPIDDESNRSLTTPENG